MARLLLLGLHADHTAAPLPLLVILVVVVAAVVISLCTSGKHNKPWRQRGTSAAAPLVQADGAGAASRKRLLTSLSGIGGKADRMVSWNRRSPSDGSPSDGDGSGSSDYYDEAAAMEDEAVWRKAIIMGEKCRPLEFSGHIAFDSDGNQLPIKKAAADVAKN